MRKTGKWEWLHVEATNGNHIRILRCSSCGMGSFSKTFYCPQCGADMGIKTDDDYMDHEPRPQK